MTKETTMERVQDSIEVGQERVREGLRTADQKARSFIAARPVTSLLLALGIGFAVGRVVSRL